jgi:hypothetical protein
MASFKSAVTEHCKSCVFDSSAAGTWRQRVTLCSVKKCDLWKVRPRTLNAIPESVLSYYGVKNDDCQEIAGHIQRAVGKVES